MNTAQLEITTPSDREIAITRDFNARRELVWDAYTKPELLKRWLGFQNDWTFETCEVDLRVGGAFRFVWKHPKWNGMGMGGIYTEIVKPERIRNTEKFDEAWYEGEASVTVTFVEHTPGKTTLTLTILYDSKEIRDTVLESPMKDGIAASFDNLDKVLA